MTAEPHQGKIWECPDLFELDGKDVLIVSPIAFTSEGARYTNVNSSVYFVGKVDWDTYKFIPESYEEIDSGLDFYAPQTLKDDRNRRILIAWQQMWGRNIPTDDLGHHWAGSMIIPRELRLVDGKLIQTIVSEYNEALTLASSQNVDRLYRGQLEPFVQLETTEPFSIEIGADEDCLQFDYDRESLMIDRTNLQQSIQGEEEQSDKRSKCYSSENLIVKIYVDKACCEIIVNDEVTFSTTFYLESVDAEIKVKGKDLKIDVYNKKI